MISTWENMSLVSISIGVYLLLFLMQTQRLFTHTYTHMLTDTVVVCAFFFFVEISQMLRYFNACLIFFCDYSCGVNPSVTGSTYSPRADQSSVLYIPESSSLSICLYGMWVHKWLLGRVKMSTNITIFHNTIVLFPTVLLFTVTWDSPLRFISLLSVACAPCLLVMMYDTSL